MATTHEEIYRPFEGALSRRAIRLWPILVGGVRVATKRKIPLLLLYGYPAIVTLLISGLVYINLTAQDEPLPDSMGGALASMAVSQVKSMLETRNQIFQLHESLGWFALLVSSWFGAGLICDDRRVGAHQLYFCRPLTRLDYFLGKFLCAAFFAALASVAPALVVCGVATFASPDWTFLTEQWDIPLRALAYSAVWITVVVSLVLTASSIAPRKSFALVGVFGFFFVSEALGNVLGEVQSESLYILSVSRVIQSISGQLFQRPAENFDVAAADAWIVLSALVAFCLATITVRLRRMEVVG